LVRVRIGSEEQELSWEEWEARIRAGRIPLDAMVRIEAVTGGAWVAAGELEMVRALRDERALDWRSRFGAGPPPLLTAILVGVQIRIWWWAWNSEHLTAALLALLPTSMAPVLEDAQIWRPLTMGIVQTDLDHLALNMMWLAYTGWNIERALGRANLATLFFASVLTGAVLSLFGEPHSSSIGSSGGVFGLIAASVVFGLLHPDLLPSRARRLYGLALLPYLVVMFWMGLQSETTDNWGHFGGLVCGATLGALLDPIGLERRAGWNRRVRRATGMIVIAGLLGLGLAGPRLVPLGPPDDVRADALGRAPTAEAEKRADPLVWAVPRSWSPGSDRQRQPAFVSPSYGGTTRAFGVRVTEHDHLVTPEELAEAFAARVRDRSPGAVVEAATPTSVAGRGGIGVAASVPDGDRTLRVEWRAAVRGVWALEETWQVEADAHARLGPLVERMRRKVAWGDPIELVDARAAVDERPASAKARGELALALARVGDAREALALHDALVAEAPDDLDRRVARLDAVALLLPADAEERWTDALAASPEPEEIVAVARGLEAAGREEETRGLLRVAWDRLPGERTLRRARSARDLPIALDPGSGLPWDLAFVPATGAPRPRAEIEARQAAPLDLPSARAAGAAVRAEREATIEAAVRAVRASDPTGVVPLLALKEGFFAPEQDLVHGLDEDLESLAEGATPDWMPAEVADALRTHPEYRGAISSR
jgi:membrane associated rhomboid family serine protease